MRKGTFMKSFRTALSVLIVTIMVWAVVPIASWAESNVPEPGQLFPNEINRRAKGKKLTGFLTIAYEFGESPDPDACPGLFVNNMFVVTTMERRGEIKPFNTDFTRTGTEPFCFDDLASQVAQVKGLLREAVDFFFGSTSTFQIKSIKEFLSSGTGAISMEIRLAVKPGANEFED
jgi:hypothetical protein